MRAAKRIGYRWRWEVFAIASTLFATGCKKETAVEEVTHRPVITITVPAATTETQRRFSGIATSAVGGGISFEVGGRVTSVLAKAGERYEAGDELAKLSPEEYLNQLANIKAQLTEAEQTLSQTEQLFAIKNATKAQLDTAIAQKDALTAQLASAQKKVDDCVLKMPYAGVIGSVDLDEQSVVSAGQTVMQIQKSGGVEFEAGLPSDVVGQVAVGMPAKVKLSKVTNGAPGLGWDAEVITVSTQANDNTTFSVTFALKGDTDEIRDGMDGEAILSFGGDGEPVLWLPSECVLGGAGGESFVWVVIPSEQGAGLGTVERRPVELTGKLGSGGTIGIKPGTGDGGGVKEGDLVISRGVNSVEVGQVVRVNGN